MQNGRHAPAAGSWSRDLTDRWGQVSLSSLRSVGATLASGLRAGYDSLTVDPSDKELVTTVKFASLECGTPAHPVPRRVLLLGYQHGFQVWDLEDARLIRELTSRRDGAVRCLEAVPLPSQDSHQNALWANMRPCLAVAPLHPSGPAQEGQGEQEYASAHKPQWQVQLYSLRNHTYFHAIEVASRVLGLRCSCRILAVALDSQVLGFGVGTMELVFSVMTHPAPGTNVPGGSENERFISVPLALGPRWLAYAANQGVQAAAGCAVAQHPGGNPQPDDGIQNGQLGPNYQAMSAFAKSAAKLSGKQLRSFSEASYKYLSSQYDTWRGGNAPPGSAIASAPADAAQAGSADIAGTVMVRDVVTRSVVAHFRAHTSPLHVLDFDPSGTLLVTASVHGHSIHIFQIRPPAGGRSGGGSCGIPCMGSALHLFRLSRGVTPAVIQGLSFSSSGDWLAVSSARGTGHLFHLAAAAPSSQSVPAHLAAANAAGGAGGQGCSSVRGALPATKLVASGRVRGGGNGLLNGNIPGSAAASAAVSLYNGSPGCPSVASAFMPPRTDEAQLRCASDCGPEDLLMVSADGLLTRHHLRMCTPHQNGRHLSNDTNVSSAASAPSMDRGQEGSHEVVAEADAQWDICRRSTWPEREEAIETDMSIGNGCQSLPAEQQRQQWMAQAETWVPTIPMGNMPMRSGAFPSVPLWADPQFHLLEMRSASQQAPVACAGRAESLASTSEPLDFRSRQQVGAQAASSAMHLLQVEEVPTRRVTAAKASLAPVMTKPIESTVAWRSTFAASHRSSAWNTPSVTPTNPSAHMRSGSFSSEASLPACRTSARGSFDGAARLPGHAFALGGHNTQDGELQGAVEGRGV